MSPPRMDEAYERSSRMVGRRIGGEFVLVPLAGRGADIDSIYNLNRAGAFIWEQLDGQTTGTTIVERMIEQFEVDPPRAAADYLDFLRTLRTLDAVVLAGGSRP